MANGSLWDINSSLSMWLMWACFWIIIYMGAGLEKIEEKTGLYWAWGGVLFQFALTQMAAMYVGIGVTNTIMSRAGGSSFYYQYRGGSVIGDYLGLYGMLTSFLFYGWAIIASLAGFYLGDGMIMLLVHVDHAKHSSECPKIPNTISTKNACAGKSETVESGTDAGWLRELFRYDFLKLDLNLES